MSVKITLEYSSVEEAVVALGKLSGLGKVRRAAQAEPSTDAGGVPAGTQPQATVEASATAAPVTTPPAPATDKPQRKPRADKGQPRGPYAPRDPNAAGASVASVPGAAASTGATAAPAATAGNSTGATTDPSNAGQQAAASTSTTASAPGVAAAAPSAPPTTAPAAPTPTPEQVQGAVETLFQAKGYDDCALLLSRFGVKRGKDLLPAQRADFINRVAGIIERGEAI